MRQVPAAMTAIWKSGVFTGPNRPIARVTIQQTQIQVRNYLLERYSIYNFGNPREVVELPNVKSVKWSRSIDSDAGTCDIELYNTAELPLGVAPNADDFVYNQPGFYTATRGGDTNRWNHTPNHFTGRLYPDMLIRTYEGYGFDKSVGPEVDPHMMQSGVWIIDDIILGADATITVKCRDAARLAMDQLSFPPVVSEGLYPLKFEHFVTIADPPVPSGGGGNAKWINPPFNSSSAVPYGGANIDIHGHRASDAYDGNDNCVDEETEILTQRGWLRWDEVCIGDQSLAVDPNTGESSWQSIEHLTINQNYDGPMISIEGNRHSSLTTPNHRWLTWRRGRGISTNGQRQWHWKTSETLTDEDRIPVSAPRSDCPDVSPYTNEFVEIVAWWWTEGHQGLVDGRKVGGNISQSHAVNGPKVDRIRKALWSEFGPPGRMSRAPHHTDAMIRQILRLRDQGVYYKDIEREFHVAHQTVKKWEAGDLPARWRETSSNSGGTSFVLSMEVLRLLQLAAPDRVLDSKFLVTLTLEQLRLFVHTSIDGDGSHLIHATKLSQTSQARQRAFEMACVLAGYGVSTNTWNDETMWTTLVSRSDSFAPAGRSRTSKPTRVQYQGVIWCPTLRHGNWFARRHGKVYLTGNSYWLSIGNSSPSADFAYEWIQSKFTTLRTVSAVRVFVKGGPYRVYVSLHTTDNGGHWVGSAKIPYDPNDDASSPNGANIRYVKTVKVLADKDSTINVKNVKNVDLVRLTFHHLWDSGIGIYPYRAAVRDVDVLVDTNGTETWASVSSHIEGNYNDYSDIVKWLLGYAGFLWPTAAALAYQRTTAGRVNSPVPTLTYDWAGGSTTTNGDPVLWGLNADDYDTKVTGQGRQQIGEIWGDIEQSGTFGPSDLTTNIFDKKPLWDGIAYIRDILGFICYIDETGAAVFRSPNIWRLGNNLSTPGYRLTTFATHVNDPVTGFVHIDESQTLMGLQATLSGRNTREIVIVANVTGDKGAVVNGFSPSGLPPSGMRRVAIWSDQHFLTTKECRIMADLIAIRQLFTFRTDSITIPGYPAIQIDDQIKLTEGVTEEMDDVHYVKGITSTLDMSSGDWDYQLDTHWLGTEPFGKWAFNPDNLSADTQAYLTDLGKIG